MDATLSPLRRRGLRDLVIAVTAGAAIWIADMVTGGHLTGSVNALAVRLSGWYEDRRTPSVLCRPGKPRSYTALPGVVFDVPPCWEVEVVPLLDREVHRFHDPEARAGTVSISLEPIESEEDRRGLEEEFTRMGALPGARRDGAKVEASAAPYAPSVPDSLAERILHGEERGPLPRDAAPAGGFRSVEAGGLIGAPPVKGESTRQPDGSYSKRTWTWLLLGDRQAVRIVYAVRADWSDSGVVGQEFQRVDALARSVTPAP